MLDWRWSRINNDLGLCIRMRQMYIHITGTSGHVWLSMKYVYLIYWLEVNSRTLLYILHCIYTLDVGALEQNILPPPRYVR